MLYLLIYISLISLSLFWLKIMSKHIKKILQSIQYDLDELIYMFDKIIYMNRQNITDYNWALDIIFDNKKKFVFWSHHDIYDFWDFFQSLKDDYIYITKLFDQKFIDDSFFDELKSKFDVAIKTFDIYNFSLNAISILSLWMSKFILKK